MKIGNYDITSKNVISFLVGNTLYALDALEISNLDDYQRIQLYFRSVICKACLKNKECIVCSCSTPNMFYDPNKEDSLCRWGKMMNKEKFLDFLKDNDIENLETFYEIYGPDTKIKIEEESKEQKEIIKQNDINLLLDKYTQWYQDENNYKFDLYVTQKRDEYLSRNTITELEENVYNKEDMLIVNADNKQEKKVEQVNIHKQEIIQVGGDLIKIAAYTNKSDNVENEEVVPVETIHDKLRRENKILQANNELNHSYIFVNNPNSTISNHNEYIIADNLVYNFNTVSITDDLQYTFKYLNTTNIPLTIKAMGSSCGCTAVKQIKEGKVIKPNDYFEITLNYINKNYGDFEKMGYVYYNEIPNITTLSLKGTIK